MPGPRLWLASVFGILRRRERGQLFAVAALSLAAVFGFMAFSTDVGVYLSNVRDGQNDVDAAAMAGAQELIKSPPDSQSAVTKATEWAAKNGAGDQLDWQMDCGTDQWGAHIPPGVSDSDGDGDPDTICVGLQRSVPALFARVLGIEGFSVKRTAAARAVHAAGAAVCPWALIARGPEDPGDGTYYGIKPGVVYAVKVDDPSVGNFGVLDLGFSGTDGYTDLVRSGCTETPYNVFTEGDSVVTGPEPGNVGNPTRQALNDYFAYELSDGEHDSEGYGWCDVSFTPDPLSPSGEGMPTGYNPVEGPVRHGCGTDAANGGNGRWMSLVIIDQFPSGSSDTIHILGVASVYLARWDRTGSPAQMQVYIMFSTEAKVQPWDLVGLSDNPLAPLHILLIK